MPTTEHVPSMTEYAELLSQRRQLARQLNYINAEIRAYELEHMPAYAGVVGKGYGGTSPALPSIVEKHERSLTDIQRLIHARHGGRMKAYRMGEAHIELVEPEGDEGWQMSISMPHHLPDWNYVAAAWYELVPDAEHKTGALLLPPADQYVNVHHFCLHVQEIFGDDDGT